MTRCEHDDVCTRTELRRKSVVHIMNESIKIQRERWVGVGA